MKAILEAKTKKVYKYLEELGSALVCYSGGTDSVLLMELAKRALGNNAHGVFFDSAIIPRREADEALELAALRGFNVHKTELNTPADPLLTDNPKERCYICKHLILSKALAFAKELHLAAVLEGSQADDLKADRPGRKAIKELNVLSPLEYAGFSKDDVRELSRMMDLPTWNKQSFSCLMTRFAHGEIITEEKLNKLEEIENFLLSIGMTAFRARPQSNNLIIELRDASSAKVSVSAHESIIKQMIAFGFENISFKNNYDKL